METSELYRNQTYQFEEIPGKGRCLVPIGPLPVSPEDVRAGRVYRSRDGNVIGFVRAWHVRADHFMMVFHRPRSQKFETWCRPVQTAAELAQHVNDYPLGDIGFQEWIQ